MPATDSAHGHLAEALRALADLGGAGAEDTDLLAVLTLAENTGRHLDRIAVTALATLQRRGTLTERGYRHPAAALVDLLGCDRAEARRRVLVAEQTSGRTTLDGTPLPPRLPATATAFHRAALGLRHVETITRLLDSPAAHRLDPTTRAAAEQTLADHGTTCSPADLHTWGVALIEALDADGPEPDDDHPPVQVNELRLRRHRDRPGGTLTGRFDDAAMFDAIATVLDIATRPGTTGIGTTDTGATGTGTTGTGALGHRRTGAGTGTTGASTTDAATGIGTRSASSGRTETATGTATATGIIGAPDSISAGGGTTVTGTTAAGAATSGTGDITAGDATRAAGTVTVGARDVVDDRTPAQRRAAALADACAYVLDHGNLPRTGGTRPHLTVLVRLEDLEDRARAAVLDLGGTLTPAGLRMLACDAAVVPVVLGGQGQPLDVGRATRTIPDGLRRAVTARDRGCARCGRPPSWCEIHHLHPWHDGGPTALHNLLMLCRACHRLTHHAGWTAHLTPTGPEFTPPAWIDPDRRPRPGPPRTIDLDALLAAARDATTDSGRAPAPPGRSPAGALH